MLVRKLSGRGATGVVEIHGELLFAPHADLPRWKKRMTGKVLSSAQMFAPSNKRPRWSHYGAPLKKTMRASTTTRITAGGGFLYSAVASTADHALYVDQGTGIYGGAGAYQGKILPPWTRGSPSLFESTWSPNTATRRPVGTVTIKGQKGQFFFDKALMSALRSSGMKTVGVPNSDVRGKANTIHTTMLEVGGFSRSPTFQKSLKMWREWRDDAWSAKGPDGKATLGEGAAAQRHVNRRIEDIRRRHDNLNIRAEIRKVFAKDAKRAKRKAAEARREAEKVKSVTKAKSPKKQATGKDSSRAADKTAFLVAMRKKYGNGNVDTSSLEYKNGYWVVLVREVTENKEGNMRPEWKVKRAKAKS